LKIRCFNLPVWSGKMKRNPMNTRWDDFDRGRVNDRTVRKNGLSPLVPNRLIINSSERLVNQGYMAIGMA
jgi:hypothetical protein